MNGAGRKVLGEARLRGLVDKSGRRVPIAVFVGLDRAGKGLDGLGCSNFERKPFPVAEEPRRRCRGQQRIAARAVWYRELAWRAKLPLEILTLAAPFGKLNRLIRAKPMSEACKRFGGKRRPAAPLSPQSLAQNLRLCTKFRCNLNGWRSASQERGLVSFCLIVRLIGKPLHTFPDALQRVSHFAPIPPPRSYVWRGRGRVAARARVAAPRRALA